MWEISWKQIEQWFPLELCTFGKRIIRTTHQISQSEPKTQITATYFLPDPSLGDTVQRRTLDSLSSLYSIRTVNILFHFKHFRLYKRIVVVDDDVCMHSLKVWYKKKRFKCSGWKVQEMFHVSKGCISNRKSCEAKSSFFTCTCVFWSKGVNTEDIALKIEK